MRFENMNKITIKTELDFGSDVEKGVLAIWLSDNPEDNDDHIGEISCVSLDGKIGVAGYLTFEQLQDLAKTLGKLGYVSTMSQNEAYVSAFFANMPLLAKKGLLLCAKEGKDKNEAIATIEAAGKNWEVNIPVPVGDPFSGKDVADSIGEFKDSQKRTLCISNVWCQASYEGKIRVPARLTLEEAIEYAKDHIDEIVIEPDTLTYLPDSDNIDEEDVKARFDEGNAKTDSDD
jgi:hypothetical protein